MSAGGTILIVDDTPTNLQLLLDTLEGAGFEVLGATDGEQALQRAALGRPDLILLDVVMPGIDGFETCRRLKSDPTLGDIPVIFLTALGDTPDKLSGFAAGGVDYLTKPLDHEEVLVRVRTHLTLRSLQQALAAQNQQLQAITAALIRFLQTGQREEASALLLDSALHQTHSPLGLVGMLGAPSQVHIVLTRGACDALELPEHLATLLRRSPSESATMACSDLEGWLGPVFTTGRLQQSQAGNSTLAFLSAPIQQGERTVGVLTVANDKGYADAQRSALEQLAQAARVIYECDLIKQREAEAHRQRKRREEEIHYLREEIKTEHNFIEIIGASAALGQLLNQIERVAPTASSVLIHGETGTGKELIARALHELSPRKDRPLIKLNCAALPDNLIESELFGHEKGAFTGAITQRKGRFELADGGTLFLDEVGDLPLAAQAKLLRVLQEREFERVGGSRALRVDVRVLAATHRDLPALAAAGRFREDLYYRLNVFPIEVPPLRERREDIVPLAEFFLQRCTAKLRVPIDRIAEDTLARLQAYPWPGNIRELQNLIERAVILANDTVLDIPAALLPLPTPPKIPADPSATNPLPAPSAVAPGEQLNFTGTLEKLERHYILQVLASTYWAVEGERGAAARLGLNASTLRSRMRKLGIQKP